MPIGAYHPFLESAVKSLLAQEATVEIAFLDASNDPRVSDIAHRYSEHLAYRRHGPDGGQSDAILEGWANTGGEILGWLNADDILFPGAIDRALQAFRNTPSADLVYAHSTILDDDARTISYHWAVEDNPARILEGGIISQPSCFFRRTAYDRAGGLNADLHYTMDWDLWIRLFKSGANFVSVDDVWSLVLWAEGTKTSSFNETRRNELKRIINEYAPLEKQKKIMRSFAIHNWVERIPSKTIQNLVSRSLIRGRKEIQGISGDGLIANGATLPLVHYDDEPKKNLRINVSAPEAIEKIERDGAGAPHEITSAGEIMVALHKPAAAAETVHCKFIIKDGRTCYLRSAVLD